MRSSHVKILLVVSGLVVLAGVGAVAALMLDKFPTGQLEQLVGGESNRPKHDEHAETKWITAIAEDRESNNTTKLMEDELEYGDWLYQQKRYIDSIAHYAASAEIAKRRRSIPWEAAALRRQGLAMHREYLNDSSFKPDPAVVEKAIELGLSPEFDDGAQQKLEWEPDLALLYADVGRFPEAEKLIDKNIKINKSIKSKDLNDTYLTKAQILMSANKPKAAFETLEAAALDMSKKDTDDLRTAALRVEDKQRNEMTQRVQSMFKANDFAGIEKIAADLRKSERQIATGQWHIQALYESIYIPAGDTDEKWEAHIAKLEKWVKDRPESITARVALADALVDYAWRARGSGYSDTVSAEGSKHMEERLKAANEVLEKARGLKEKCPVWFVIRQSVALGEGMPKDEYASLVQECRKTFPKFYPTLFKQAYFLQPRWYGGEGEWNTTVIEALKDVPEGDEDAVYAQTVWSVTQYYDNVFDEAGADWTRCKRGLIALDKKYPRSPTLQIATMQLAAQAGDEHIPKASSCF